MTHLRFAPTLLLLALPACIDFGPHQCTQDAQCAVDSAQGSCVLQDGGGGYCALPDDDCGEPPLRYVPEAAGGLAGTCVGAGGGTDSGGTGSTSMSGPTNPTLATTQTTSSGSLATTMTDPTEPSESSTTDGESSSATTDTPTVDCIDRDEDGYGEGEDCRFGPDCDDGQDSSQDNCLYIGPDVSEKAEQDGTRLHPFRRFEDAFAALQTQGRYSLVMLDGLYTPGNGGELCMSATPGMCGYQVANGSMDAPLRLLAENEGSVAIEGSDGSAAMRVVDLSHWSFEGFTVARPVTATSEDPGVGIVNGADLEFRRIVVPRCSPGEALFEMYESERIDVIESAVHDPAATRGFTALGSTDITFRRCYARIETSEISQTTPFRLGADSDDDFGANQEMINCISTGGDASVRVEGPFTEGSLLIEGSLLLSSAAGIVNRDIRPPPVVVRNSVIHPRQNGPLAFNAIGTPFDSLTLENVTGWTEGIGFDLGEGTNCTPECDNDAPYPHSLTDSVLAVGTLLSLSTLESEAEDWLFEFDNLAVSSGSISAPFAVPEPGTTLLPGPDDVCVVDPDHPAFEGRGARIVDKTPGLGLGESAGPLWQADGRFPCPIEFDGMPPTGCEDVHTEIGVDGASCPTP